MNEFDFDELVVDSDVTAPGPLDPAIASLILRTKSNRVTEGYELSVSAFFGSEKILLTGGDFSVNVEISIDRAQIDLKFVRCAPSLLDIGKGEFSDERKIEQKLTATRRRKRRGSLLVKGQLSASFQGNGSAELGYETTSSNDAELEISRSRKNWERIRSGTVMVGTVVGDLEGMEIDDFVGWRVIPDDTTSSSGVVAFLSVRESWINIVEVDSESFTGRIGKKAKDLFQSDNKRKQQLFALLLRHLSSIGLSRPSHPGQAILAVEPFVVRPETEIAISARSAPSSGSVPLSSTKIEEFLDSSPGSEVETLVSMGLGHRDIREYVDQPKHKEAQFAGMSSPHSALEAYKIICERKSILRTELEQMVRGRVVADLKNLELIKVAGNMLHLPCTEIKNPEDMLRFAAAKADFIVTTRNILMNDSSASGKQIAEMLVTKFGKKYLSDSSKTRVGNTLLRWTRWLEPHLIDPSSADGARMIITAREKSNAVGRRSLATPENVAYAKAAIEAGESFTSVAKSIGITTQTLARWRVKGILN